MEALYTPTNKVTKTSRLLRTTNSLFSDDSDICPPDGSITKSRLHTATKRMLGLSLHGRASSATASPDHSTRTISVSPTRVRALSAVSTISSDSDLQVALMPSLFPYVPPTINFVLEGQRGNVSQNSRIRVDYGILVQFLKFYWYNFAKWGIVMVFERWLVKFAIEGAVENCTLYDLYKAFKMQNFIAVRWTL